MVSRTIFGFLTLVLCLAHALAIFQALEGRAGLSNGWPLWRDDHPLYFHSALVTKAFLARSWTTAGYDPSFMSGYAKSVVFPASSTLPELVVAVFGGSRPELAYKVYVGAAAAVPPFLIALSALVWRVRAAGVFASVVTYLIYLWTDFPINYAAFGMLPYLLGIPLGLLSIALFSRYLEQGGALRWFFAATSMAIAVLVHFTTAMIVAPSACAAILGCRLAARRDGGDVKPWRWLGIVAIPLVVLALNAFWWLPGLWLASTKGASDFAFVHPEGALQRLVQIVRTEARIELVLIIGGAIGFAALPVSKAPKLGGLASFLLAGFAWGYLASSLETFEFLQPGRHTYAFYSGLCVAFGLGIGIVLDALERRVGYRTDWVAVVFLLACGTWYFGGDLQRSLSARVFSPIPFLSSRPSPRLLWVVKQAKTHLRHGERLLYEEGGFGIPGLADPFQGGRFSGLLPSRLGIELIGGPYLHASLTTNFTQFGEGKLFGKENWDRAWFVRYAALYRPSAILCWTPHARAFCHANPDLVDILADDGALLFGRVKGFGGVAIRGKAKVEAVAGELRVKDVEADLDGSVVLRYHSVPCLRTQPRVAWDSVLLEGDPVPFIRLRPPPGLSTFDLSFPPSPSPPP